MSTTKKYVTRFVNGDEFQFATKQSAIRTGEKVGEPFRVYSPSGVLVHDAMGDDDLDPGPATETDSVDTNEDSIGAGWPEEDVSDDDLIGDDEADTLVITVNYRPTGAVAHWQPLRAAAIHLVERLPLDGVLSARVIPGWVLELEGTDRDDLEAAAVAVEDFWVDARAALATHKKDRQASRKIWEAEPGRPRLEAEWKYLTKFGKAYPVPDFT